MTTPLGVRLKKAGQRLSLSPSKAAGTVALARFSDPTKLVLIGTISSLLLDGSFEKAQTRSYLSI